MPFYWVVYALLHHCIKWIIKNKVWDCYNESSLSNYHNKTIGWEEMLSCQEEQWFWIFFFLYLQKLKCLRCNESVRHVFINEFPPGLNYLQMFRISKLLIYVWSCFWNEVRVRGTVYNDWTPHEQVTEVNMVSWGRILKHWNKIYPKFMDLE